MKNIICFGEVLWDQLPSGKKLGGAPLNVALRAQSFGHKTAVISSIGNDSIGEELILAMKQHNAELSHIQTSKNFATSEVLVHLNEKGSASYEIKMPCAWDDIERSEKDTEAVKNSDAFIYGSLTARSEKSRNTLFGLLEQAPFKVFDVNLRPPHYTQERLMQLMQHADFIKFNDEEIIEICGNMGAKEQKVENCMKYIAKQTNTAKICVTCGKHGAVLLNDGKLVYNKGYTVTVADTVGSGDSFLAALISKLLENAAPQEAIDFACAIGALVASKKGANDPISQTEIAALMQAV